MINKIKINKKNNVFRDLISKLINSGTPKERLFIILNIKEFENEAQYFLNFEEYEDAFYSMRLFLKLKGNTGF